MMHQTLEDSFAQWDKQVNDPQLAYIRLNNVYLWVERGHLELNKLMAGVLRSKVSEAYPDPTDPMRDWWMDEFTKLPGWLEV